MMLRALAALPILLIASACGDSGPGGYEVRVQKETGLTAPATLPLCGSQGMFHIGALDPSEVLHGFTAESCTEIDPTKDLVGHYRCGSTGDWFVNVPQDLVQRRSTMCESSYDIHISPIGVF